MARWNVFDWAAGVSLFIGVAGLTLLAARPRDTVPAPPVVAPVALEACTPRTLQLTTYDMGAPFSDLEARCPAGSTPTIDMRELLPGRGTQLVLDCTCMGRG